MNRHINTAHMGTSRVDTDIGPNSTVNLGLNSAVLCNFRNAIDTGAGTFT